MLNINQNVKNHVIEKGSSPTYQWGDLSCSSQAFFLYKGHFSLPLLLVMAVACRAACMLRSASLQRQGCLTASL